MATGYDSVTGSLLDMNIRNKHGVRLQDLGSTASAPILA
ncbi:cyclopentanone monooxygenase [Colletotrichum truncatum]|uniref:Cyclopentanone monooxygenase n=1 Tax=Colletotrichum truncatum TaxID=5467 RepID=A0ACC3YEI0_COLTU